MPGARIDGQRRLDSNAILRSGIESVIEYAELQVSGLLFDEGPCIGVGYARVCLCHKIGPKSSAGPFCGIEGKESTTDCVRQHV